LGGKSNLLDAAADELPATQNSFDRKQQVRRIGLQKIAVRTRSESPFGDLTRAILSEEE
jgi:hypothetical protein